MLPGLPAGTGRPTTLPAALAEDEVDTPVKCCRNPGKIRSVVPLERCWNAPLARQSAAAQEGAADERVALLDEIGEERLGAIRGAATTDTQRTEDEPAAPAARIARRPGAAGHEPVDGSGVAVRDEVRLVARPTSASAGVTYGREAGSRAGGLGRGCGG